MDKGNKKEDFISQAFGVISIAFGVNSISLGVNSKGYGDRIQTFKKA